MSSKKPGIRELRELAGLTQSIAARVSKVNHAKISMAENGEITLNDEEEARLRGILIAAIRTRIGLMADALDMNQSS